MNWHLLSKETKSPSATTEVICLPFKEWKKKKGFSFRFWLILVKHVEFGARLVSNPRWFVCERYFCLPAFSAIIGCQLNLFILFNNAWLSNLHYQLEVSINSKKRRPFPGLTKGISQNIIQRVFLKLQETLKWISIIYIFSGAPKLFFSFKSSLLIVWPMERKQESFWVYYPLFRLILFTFYIS